MTQTPPKFSDPNSTSGHASALALPSPSSRLDAQSPVDSAAVPPRPSQPAARTSSRWLRGLSLRTRVTVLAIALGTVPVLVVGGFATYIASRTINQEALDKRLRLAVEVNLQVSDFVQDRLNDVQTIAKTPFIVNPSTRSATSPEIMVSYLDSFVERDPSYDLISAVTPDGAYARVDDNRVPLRTSKGEVPPEVDKPEVKLFVDTNSSFFLEARRTLRPAVAPMRLSVSVGKSFFYMAAPALNTVTDKLAYVIYSRTETTEISRLLSARIDALLQQSGDSLQEGNIRFSVLDHGTAFFETGADGQEKEIVSTRIKQENNSVQIDGKPFQPGGAILAKTNRILVSDDSAKLGQDIRAVFPKYAELRALGRTGTAIDVSKADGQEYLLTYVPVPKIGDLSIDWGVLVYEPTAVVFAPQRTLILSLLMGTVITAMLVGAVAATIASRSIRPILNATAAVEKIGQGELETRVAIEGEDEIGVLSTNINTMAAQLQTLLDAQAFEVEQERLLTAAKGSGVLHPADLQMIFDQSVEGARSLLGLDRVVFYRFNNRWQGGVVSESVRGGWTSALETNVSDACIPEELRAAYREGRVLLTPDVSQAEFDPEHLRLLATLQVKALLVLPVISGEQLFGLLIAHTCAASHEWQEQEISFLKRLATELGLTIYRVDLLEQTERQAAEQRQLKEQLQKRALELLQEVDPISRGDLTVRAKVTVDEIGTIADSYNATVDNLRKIVVQVQGAANQVASTTSINESLVQTLSLEALRQAEEIAAALGLVKQMANAVQQVAINASYAEKAAQEAAQTVEEGDVVMNRTVEGIQVIRSTVAETAKKVKHLGESSQKISKVVELISAFAAQTNMLALSASIEASRAGEQAKGFAVVAGEVRSLARQSAEATEEIKNLVTSIQAETQEVAEAMEAGIEQVTTGTLLVEDTRQSLNKITAVSNQISELVEAIAQATTMQSQTSEAVIQTMEDVVQIASKTSSEAQQVSSSFEHLQQVAQTLQAEVSQFKVS